MKWNYETNLPVEGTYQHRVYDKEKLKTYVEERFTHEVVRKAFEFVGWDLESLVLHKDNIDFYDEFYLSILVDLKDNLEEYWVDLANGHISITLPPNYTWGGVPNPIRNRDIYRRLFFCDTEEDVWDVFHDLPFEIENNLKECYYGYSPVTWFPVCIKDPQKARMMHEYLYGKPENLGILIHLGSKMRVVDDDEFTGTIIGLAEDHIAVRIDYPLECTMSYYVPKDSLDKTKLTVVIDNQYIATEYARDMAMGMTIQIHWEVMSILKDVEKLHDMLVEYRKKQGIHSRFELLSELKQKYFPVGVENVDFNEDLMSQIELYVKDSYCED